MEALDHIVGWWLSFVPDPPPDLDIPAAVRASGSLTKIAEWLERHAFTKTAVGSFRDDAGLVDALSMMHLAAKVGASLDPMHIIMQAADFLEVTDKMFESVTTTPTVVEAMLGFLEIGQRRAADKLLTALRFVQEGGDDMLECTVMKTLADLTCLSVRRLLMLEISAPGACTEEAASRFRALMVRFIRSFLDEKDRLREENEDLSAEPVALRLMTQAAARFSDIDTRFDAFEGRFADATARVNAMEMSLEETMSTFFGRKNGKVADLLKRVTRLEKTHEKENRAAPKSMADDERLETVVRGAVGTAVEAAVPEAVQRAVEDVLKTGLTDVLKTGLTDVLKKDLMADLKRDLMADLKRDLMADLTREVADDVSKEFWAWMRDSSTMSRVLADATRAVEETAARRIDGAIETKMRGVHGDVKALSRRMVTVQSLIDDLACRRDGLASQVDSLTARADSLTRAYQIQFCAQWNAMQVQWMAIANDPLVCPAKPGANC